MRNSLTAFVWPRLGRVGVPIGEPNMSFFRFGTTFLIGGSGGRGGSGGGFERFGPE